MMSASLLSTSSSGGGGVGSPVDVDVVDVPGSVPVVCGDDVGVDVDDAGDEVGGLCLPLPAMRFCSSLSSSRNLLASLFI